MAGSVSDSKIPVMLLDMVPEGYYAVRGDESESYTFLRLSRPTKGRFKGTTKVQTQHGNRLEVAWCVWPGGQVSSYLYTIEDAILLMISDHQWAARTYARVLGHCCRCNADLTDDRSRHYGIGPECEKYWPWMIVIVDAEDEEASA